MCDRQRAKERERERKRERGREREREGEREREREREQKRERARVHAFGNLGVLSIEREHGGRGLPLGTPPYFRRIDFVHYSTLGWIAIQKKKKIDWAVRVYRWKCRCPSDRGRTRPPRACSRTPTSARTCQGCPAP